MRGLWDRETVALLLLASVVPLAVTWLLATGTDGLLRLVFVLAAAGFWHLAFMLARAQPPSFAGAFTALAVAVLAPVERAGHRTPLLASGPGAREFAARVGPFEVPVVVVDGDAGEAARLRLLRSVFMKGLAALVVEGLGASRAVGSEEWLRQQMAQELGPDGDALIGRLVEGSRTHAVRREHEVRAALAALEATGQPADMTRATLAWFERLVAERDPE